LKIDIITIFPEFFNNFLETSLIEKAITKKLITINVHDLRKYTTDKHKTVDDKPFGGGPGMLLKIEPIYNALKELTNNPERPGLSGQAGPYHVVLLSPQGQKFTQNKAQELCREKNLVLIAGRYEGVDERVREHLIDEEVSIGDYVLSGGEVPSMVLMEAVTRLIPGVVGKSESLVKESFSEGLLDYPQYTRPEDFKGYQVPKVLLSGDHKKIEKWRKKMATDKTKQNRPDLLNI